MWAVTNICWYFKWVV